jgi:hypothetical protein
MVTSEGSTVIESVVESEVSPVIESEGSTVIESEGSTVIESEGSTVIESEGSTVIESEGSTVLESEGSTVIESEGSTVLESEGSTVIESEGSTGIESEGSTVIESEGSTVIESEGSTVIESEGSTVISTQCIMHVLLSCTPPFSPLGLFRVRLSARLNARMSETGDVTLVVGYLLWAGYRCSRIGVSFLAFRPLCPAHDPRGSVGHFLALGFGRWLSRLAARVTRARMSGFSGSRFKGPGAFGVCAVRLPCVTFA